MSRGRGSLARWLSGVAGLSLTVLLGSSSQLTGSRRRAGGGQAGAPAAAERRGRTSLRPAQRRRIIGSGEDPCSCWFLRVVVHPRPGWRSGLASTHPAPRCVRRRHDHVSGDRAAQSEDRARRWRRLMPQERARPGLGDPPVFMAAGAAWPCRCLAGRPAGGRRGSGACGRSRWWRSSSRGVSRWPRRRRRIPGTAWRSGPPGS